MGLEESKIIIVGRGGSGKDFLRKKFESRGFNFCVSYTSRPQRENEIEGKDYHYVSEEYFRDNENEFYEIDEFNGWKYGHKISDFQRCNLMIMTPSGVNNVKPEDRKKCFVIFIDPDRNILLSRLSNRKDSDSAERRLKADDSDFLNFKNYDIRIKNEDF